MMKSKNRVWPCWDGTWLAEDGLPVNTRSGRHAKSFILRRMGHWDECQGFAGKTPFEALERLKAYRRKTSQPRK